MEEKKTIFDYLTQIMAVFGFTILVTNLCCLAVGNYAKEISTVFALGDRGVPVSTALEFLGLSALITGLRALFFTDIWIKKMAIWARTVCLLLVSVLVIAAFAALFRWFPVDMWQPWAAFFVCFGISFAGSCLVMTAKEKAENRKMQAALEHLNQKEQGKHE